MDKSKQLPTNLNSFPKNNKLNDKHLVWEIWEDKHPDKVIAGQKLQGGDERTFAPEQLDRMIPFWRELALDDNLQNPIITIQVDVGNGSELAYGYKDDRNEVPPNAKFHTIKPVFDENITTVRHAGKQGKSLVYHSPLNSPTLREEIMNFNKLLISFFNGEFYKILAEHSDRNPGWEFRNDVIVGNAKLRSV